MKQNPLLNEEPPGTGFIEDWAGKNGYLPLVGVDEAGRGCLAGPVVTAAVILPERFDLPALDDSKALSESRRERLFDLIRDQAVAYGITWNTHNIIDETNILAATLESMRRSVKTACETAGLIPGIVIVDGNQIIPGLEFEQRPWTKADHLSFSVAAASILAKVTRDRMMVEMDSTWPGYGFAVHKGYGTKMHMEALARLGPCEIHRKSFEPVKSMLRRDTDTPGT